VETLNRLEAAPLEEDVLVFGVDVVWRSKVRELQENSRFIIETS